MINNDKFLIDEILNDFGEKTLSSKEIDEVFEYFVYEQVLKEYDLDKNQIISGSVDGGNDGGIDAIFIFVNGHLLSEEINIDSIKNVTLNIIFFTCKHADSFTQYPVNNIISTLEEFIDFKIKNENLISKYNKMLLNKRKQIIELITRIYVLNTMEKINIRFIYACRGNDCEEIPDNIKSQGSRVENIVKENISECDSHFEFWGASKLLKQYRRKQDYTIQINSKKSFSYENQYVILVSLKDYYMSIVSDSGELKKYLFDSNVRDFMGLNSVNKDITNTLSSNNPKIDFWWLNNGITILCSKASMTGDNCIIENARIINGLQTSECIYRYIFNNSEVEDGRLLLIKILSCEDTAICDKIIKSTNNQTAISTASLWATDKIQNDIEQVLLKNNLFYDRRSNYYKNIGIQTSNIVDPLYLAAGSIALLLKMPSKSSRLKSRQLRNEEIYNQVFSERFDIRVWPIVIRCFLRIDEVLKKTKKDDKFTTFNIEKFYKRRRYIIGFLLVSKKLKKYNYTIDELLTLDFDTVSSLEINDIIDFLINLGIGFDHNNFVLNPSVLQLIYREFSQKCNIAGLEYIYGISSKYNNFFKTSKKYKVNHLVNIAGKAINDLESSKQSVHLPCMGSSERKVLHNFFSKYNWIKHYSVGEEENRHIVIEFLEHEVAL